MVATAATLQAWRAVRWDQEKALTLPALRESATMMKQVRLDWILQLFLGHLNMHYSVGCCLPFKGDDPNAHHCAEDKEEDATDSCVDCWQHAEGNTPWKNKKKKRKGKGLCNDQVRE